jgi:hypothetical protein
VVVVDACVLVKSAVRDAFLDLAYNGLIDLHWTREIFLEFVKNWPKVRVQQIERRLAAAGDPELTPEDRQRMLVELGYQASGKYQGWSKMIPEWPVPGWIDEKHARKEFAHDLPRFGVGKPKNQGVDAKDLHVALAAVQARKAFTVALNDPEGGLPPEIWLLTENLADLPPRVLLALGVISIDPTDALETLHAREPERVELSLEKTHADWKRNPLTRGQMLDLLSNPDRFDSIFIRNAMAARWGLPQMSEGSSSA